MEHYWSYRLPGDTHTENIPPDDINRSVFENPEQRVSSSVLRRAVQCFGIKSSRLQRAAGPEHRAKGSETQYCIITTG